MISHTRTSLVKGRCLRAAALLIVVSSLGNCASYEPFDPPEPGEIPEGPGLLTGESGKFVVFRGGGKVPGTGDGDDSSDANTTTSTQDGLLPPDTENRPERTTSP